MLIIKALEFTGRTILSGAKFMGLVVYGSYLVFTGKDKKIYAEIEENQRRREKELAEMNAISDALDELLALVTESQEASERGDTAKVAEITEILKAKSLEHSDTEMFADLFADLGGK